MLAIHQSTIDLARVQLVRKAALLVTVTASLFVVVFGSSYWPRGGVVHEAIEWAGIALIVICIIGRTWCSIYIGGRKIYELVRIGPYSVSRNPLYFFSIIGAVGAGAQLGSIALAVAAGVIAFVIFYAVVQKEEKALVTRYGNEYREYLAQVPRFVPKISLWRDAPSVEVRPMLIRRTFVDACVFLLSIPLAEGFEYLHDAGLMPVVFSLP